MAPSARRLNSWSLISLVDGSSPKGGFIISNSELASVLFAGTRCRCVAHTPNRIRSVISKDQRTIFRDSHADRSAPYTAGTDESSNEIVVFARRLPVLHPDANNLVPRALAT